MGTLSDVSHLLQTVPLGFVPSRIEGVFFYSNSFSCGLLLDYEKALGMFYSIAHLL